MSIDLQAPSAHRFERALSLACDPTDRISDAIDALPGLKLTNPPPSWLPYLIYEYGLGPLSPYVPNLYDLIAEGIDWQRIRGTHAAVDQALGWIGYTTAIEEAQARRRWWNSYQLALTRIRDAEGDLIRLERLAQLSAPRRSDLWRGYHGYDVRALETDTRAWDGAIHDDDSGVVIAPGTAKWSFGRSVSIDHDMTEAELIALGVWIEPPEGGALTWADLGEASWADLGEATWADDAALTRSRVMLVGTGAGPAWVVYRDAAGAVIGYRRARARHAVAADPAGPYRVGAQRLAPDPAGTMLLVEALTDFADGAGAVAASLAVILTAAPAAGRPAGARWLPAGGLDTAGPLIAETPVSIPFGLSVRERASILLRF